MEPRPKRFASSTSTDRQKTVENAVPVSTKKVTNTWVAALQAYAEEKSVQLNLTTIPAEDLAGLLEGFYADARRKNGEPYKRNSMLSARAAINRSLSSVQPSINIFKDPAFLNANRVLDGILKERKRSGEEPAVVHKDAITPGDLEKLNLYFADVSETSDPRKLSMYVWYILTTHFCLRGGEVQAKLTKSDLVFSAPDGKERVTIGTDFMSKNHTGGLKGSSFTSIGCVEDDVQISVLKNYLSKLHPDCDRLFQRAVTDVGMTLEKSTHSTWFWNSPLSHNLMSGMMRRLSDAATLSQSYTNHCLRATSITLMKQAGLEDRKIMAVSGHRNIQSLQAYDRPTAADASIAAAAIDCKPVSPSPGKENILPSTASCNPLSDVPSCDPLSDVPKSNVCSPLPPGGISVHGSSNVTIMFSSPMLPARAPPKRNPRLPLKLKKKVMPKSSES